MSGPGPGPVVRWRVAAVTGAAAVAGHASLPPDERGRAANIPRPDAWQRFVVGRALLRCTIAEHRPELADARPVIAVATSGRPYLDVHTEVEISLAHTHGLAAAVVADGAPVGIDVEPLHRPPPTPSGQWLSDRAQAWPDATTDPAGLLRRWVAKEAGLKACDHLGPAGLAAIEVHGGDAHDPPPSATSVPTPHVDAPAVAVEIARGHVTVPVDRFPDGSGPPPDGRVVVPVVWYEVGGSHLVAVAVRVGAWRR